MRFGISKSAVLTMKRVREALYHGIELLHMNDSVGDTQEETQISA